MNRFVRTSGLGLAAALLLLAGCSDAGLPTAAERAPAIAERPLLNLAGGMEISGLARFDHKPTVTIAWAKQWIGPQGGRLEFLGFAIDVPAGAVDRVTQFSIRLPVDPQGSERVVAEFGPHGTTFARPVTIELPYAGTSRYGDTPLIGWWNKRAGAWEPFDTGLTADGLRMRTETTHFSTYGSMATFGTTILVSGG